MKVLLVSDDESKYIWDYFDASKFKDIELIISCGDLKASYLSYLVTMIHAPLIYVPGNHDDKYLKNPPEGCENIDGKIYEYKGLKILGFGGSYRYNTGHFQHTEVEMKKKANKLRTKIWLKGGVDIMVTHAPAFKIGDGEDLCHRGFQTFNDLIDKYKPTYFFHGHQHLTYGHGPRIREYNETKIINAFEYYVLDI